jgi:hypothetical protein
LACVAVRDDVRAVQTMMVLVQEIIRLALLAARFITTGQAMRHEIRTDLASSILIGKVVILALGAVISRGALQAMRKDIGA